MKQLQLSAGLILLALAVGVRAGFVSLPVDPPGPPPSPKCEAVYAVILHESDRPAWLGSLIVQVQSRGLDHVTDFHVFDDDHLPASLDAIAKAVRQPALVLLDPLSGKKLTDVPLDEATTVASVQETIEEFTQ